MILSNKAILTFIKRLHFANHRVKFFACMKLIVVLTTTFITIIVPLILILWLTPHFGWEHSIEKLRNFLKVTQPIGNKARV